MQFYVDIFLANKKIFSDITCVALVAQLDRAIAF